MPTFFETLTVGTIYENLSDPRDPRERLIITSKQPRCPPYNPIDSIEILIQRLDFIQRKRVDSTLFQDWFQNLPPRPRLRIAPSQQLQPQMQAALTRINMLPLHDTPTFYIHAAILLGQIPPAPGPRPVAAPLIARHDSNESDTDMFDPADYEKAFANGQINQAAGAKSRKTRAKRGKGRTGRKTRGY